VEQQILSRERFPRLLQALRGRGYRVIGPRVRDGAIVHDEIREVEDLPIGWGDTQEGGRYRLHRRSDEALFGYVVGPHSWKQLFFVPEERLVRIRRTGPGFSVEPEPPVSPRVALFGARSCDLAAVAVQDRILMEDGCYAARRADVFVVAVSCGEPGRTCFCASMGTGPRPGGGFDLSLTELLDRGGEGHRFLVDVGSHAGAEIAAEAGAQSATEGDRRAAQAVAARAAASMGRKLDTRGIKELLYDNLEHPRWDEVAGRCLACTNCTLVCPTCFCSTVEDVTDLAGAEATRTRRWDSCFTLGHSHLHGGSVRASTRSRYRQWLVHKLASWIDQFGTSGCVGCGRCITWCPVGIDLTEEVAAIRGSE
jgi:ferredoxin